MAILNRIRQERIASGNLSQARLARQIDISRQTLHAIERGQRVPSLEVAHRIVEALECDLGDVFRYESELPAKDDDDGRFSIIVCLDHDPEWWKSDEVSRVTAVRSAVVTRHENRTAIRSGQAKLQVPGE